MGKIITGHQRSGTSMLRRTLSTHPDIMLSGELGCYLSVGMTEAEHRQKIWGRFLSRKNNPFAPVPQKNRKNSFHIGKNLLFLYRYIRSLRAQDIEQYVTVSNIDSALRNGLQFPTLVGDKYPDYFFQMDQLASDPDIQYIVIVRDVRDMVSSTLVKARGEWSKYWPPEMKDPRKIANRWLHMVEMVERNRDQICVIHYEQLVINPPVSLSPVGEFLGIDAKGFDYQALHTNSVGKYKQGLEPAELESVMAVAGEKMREMGYDMENNGFKGDIR